MEQETHKVLLCKLCGEQIRNRYDGCSRDCDLTYTSPEGRPDWALSVQTWETKLARVDPIDRSADISYSGVGKLDRKGD